MLADRLPARIALPDGGVLLRLPNGQYRRRSTLPLAGGSLDFDGTDDIVTGPSVALGATNTVFAWVRPDTVGEGGVGQILWHNAALGANGFFTEDAVNKWFKWYQVFGTTVGIWRTNASTVTLGAWQSVARTYDSSATTNDPLIYINGASVTVTEVSTPVGTVNTNTGVIYAGNQVGLTQTTDGKIGEWAVWTRLLSAIEIKAVYLFGVLAVPNGLALYWPMSGSVANAKDLSGNARHGTVTGAILGADPPSGQRAPALLVG